MKTSKLLNGWYRVSGRHHFSNIKLSRAYGFRQWSADIRVSETGDLRQLAGLWNTKRDAVEEASRLIERYDALYTGPMA